MYRVTVKLDVTLKRVADGKVLLESKRLSLSSNYLMGKTVLATEASKDRALRSLALDLMEQVYRLVFEAF